MKKQNSMAIPIQGFSNSTITDNPQHPPLPQIRAIICQVLFSVNYLILQLFTAKS
jgi:hypothetical protein